MVSLINDSKSMYFVTQQRDLYSTVLAVLFYNVEKWVRERERKQGRKIWERHQIEQKDRRETVKRKIEREGY